MKKTTDQKFADSINKIIEIFESGQIPDAIAHSTIPMPDIPSAKWKGMRNRILLYIETVLQGKSMDARTFKQWKEVGRYPTAGTSFYLWRPNIVKQKDKKTGEDESFITGFRPFVVFSYSDTKGKELPEAPDTNPAEVPPLMDVAEKWGIDVSYLPSVVGFWGAYSPSLDNIELATHDESTFFHELSHAAHSRVVKTRGEQLKKEQDPFQEIIAELTAAVLCTLVGRQPINEGMRYKYISRYATEAKITPVDACRKVIDDVDKCLQLILNSHEAAQKEAA